MAEKAGKNYTEAINKEKQDLESLDKQIEEITSQAKWKQNGITITDGKVTLKVGDYVAYEPQSNTTSYSITEEINGLFKQTINKNLLNWRVLGVNNNGQLELISDNVIEDEITLKGYRGYNNGVYLINEACNTLYGNATNRSIARGLAIEDIQKRMDLSVWNYKQYSGYGETKEYTKEGYRYYPEILKQEKKQYVDDVEGTKYEQSEQNEIINQSIRQQAENSIKITANEWSHSMSSENFIYPIYYELFINNNYEDYYLASRAISNRNNSYCIFKVTGNHVFGDVIDYMDDCDSDGWGYMRPVVSLGLDVEIDTTDTGRNGISVETSWKLK